MGENLKVIEYRGYRICIAPPSPTLEEWGAYIDRPVESGLEPFCGLWEKTEEKAIAAGKKEVDLWLD